MFTIKTFRNHLKSTSFTTGVSQSDNKMQGETESVCAENDIFSNQIFTQIISLLVIN